MSSISSISCVTKTRQLSFINIAIVLGSVCLSAPVKAKTLQPDSQPATADSPPVKDWPAIQQSHPAEPSDFGHFTSTTVAPPVLSPRVTDTSSDTQSAQIARSSPPLDTLPQPEVAIQPASSEADWDSSLGPSATAVSDLAQVPVPSVPLPTVDEERLAPRRPPDIFNPTPSTPPETPPLPEPLPPPAELLNPSPSTPTTPEIPSGAIQETTTVEQFEFTGNTVFSAEELAAVTEPFRGRPITFAELLSARTAVTQKYVESGYVTSGAFIPPQTLTSGTVTIQVVEGGLEAIEVRGTSRLNPGYVRSRLAIATPTPLNVPRLLEALRLLQLDPLIETVSAELSTGSGPGTSLLLVDVTEAETFSFEVFLNNGRSPSVGSFRRGATATEANLLGLGDSFTVGYTNTDGSDALDVGYILPINPRNGTLAFGFGKTSSDVIEEPFNTLDIQSESRYYDITFRQPIVQTPTYELALGLSASRRETETVFLEDLVGEAVPFPGNGNGADAQGRTRISALRFFQELTQRSAQQVIALRSQFSLGLDVLDSTINEPDPVTGDAIPDSRFLAWRGQAQLVRLLAPDTLLLLRGDIQLADQALVPIEQFGLGGQGSVRGYRQDTLLTDNGIFASAEVRLPILRIPEIQGVLQVTPFVEFGTTWNGSGREDPDPGTLASVGLGLQWQQSDRITARIDYGIPLISVESSDRTLQERGIYFSVTINPF